MKTASNVEQTGVYCSPVCDPNCWYLSIWACYMGSQGPLTSCWSLTTAVLLASNQLREKIRFAEKMKRSVCSCNETSSIKPPGYWTAYSQGRCIIAKWLALQCQTFVVGLGFSLLFDCIEINLSDGNVTSIALSIRGFPPSKAVFYGRSPSIEVGCPLMDVFHPM